MRDMISRCSACTGDSRTTMVSELSSGTLAETDECDSPPGALCGFSFAYLELAIRPRTGWYPHVWILRGAGLGTRVRQRTTWHIH